MTEAVPSRADARRLAYVGSIPGASDEDRDSDSWFTPAQYIDAARQALGGAINLDPFSSAAANEVIKADRWFTEEDNAFEQDWRLPSGDTPRTCFMNPPYSGALCAKAMTRFMDEFAREAFDEGIILVNNSTETKWFQRALGQAAAVCFTNHRIAFWNTDGKAVSGNTRGQAFLYFSRQPDADRFEAAFGHLGAIMWRHRPDATEWVPDALW